MYHKMGYLFTGLDSAALLMFKYQIYWFGQIPTIDSETGQQYSDVSILCINIFDLVFNEQNKNNFVSYIHN